jgi:hypothetical protein
MLSLNESLLVSHPRLTPCHPRHDIPNHRMCFQNRFSGIKAMPLPKWRAVCAATHHEQPSVLKPDAANYSTVQHRPFSFLPDSISESASAVWYLHVLKPTTHSLLAAKVQQSWVSSITPTGAEMSAAETTNDDNAPAQGSQFDEQAQRRALMPARRIQIQSKWFEPGCSQQPGVVPQRSTK